ncbi:hypothetical protein MNBD_PLANCTO02-3082 [hydrothermal vent metagenome]|uniref:Peptidase M48 domain-containing protein n=1 Tax=hydrothermal vent metagenome TaxID=652676 RepID=A0A3B1DZ53_9ZZZZ
MAGLFGMGGNRGGGRRRGGWKIRIVIALGLAIFALFKFYFTGGITVKDEIAIGLNATPQLIQQYNGESPSIESNTRVDEIGEKLVAVWERKLQQKGETNPYPFEFYLLDDSEIVNAFALPGGRVFITTALYKELESDAQLAGVLGHEIGHVFSRHGAKHMKKAKLTQGLVGAAGVAGGDASSAQMASMFGKLINMKYGRKDELESDRWAVKLTTEAGYDPRAMIEVMKILDRASGGKKRMEIMSSHPNPGNRIEKIKQFIKEEYPNGLPDGLEP